MDWIENLSKIGLSNSLTKRYRHKRLWERGRERVREMWSNEKTYANMLIFLTIERTINKTFLNVKDSSENQPICSA
jgi:hypothetical protein